LRGLETFQAAARQIEFSTERRAALIDALRVQNPESPALQRLAQPGTVVVATGQQDPVIPFTKFFTR
jgi:predicted N-acetyltransferase YhbS